MRPERGHRTVPRRLSEPFLIGIRSHRRCVVVRLPRPGHILERERDCLGSHGVGLANPPFPAVTVPQMRGWTPLALLTYLAGEAPVTRDAGASLCPESGFGTRRRG